MPGVTDSIKTERSDAGSYHESDYETEQTGSTFPIEEHQLLGTRIEKIVGDMMRLFLLNLDQSVHMIICQNEAAECICGSRGSAPSGSASASEQPSSKGGKRKAGGQDRGMNDSGDDEDGIQERPTKVPRRDDDDSPIAKLACPYYKYNPRKYRHAKTCSGPGWQTVHRVKYASYQG